MLLIVNNRDKTSLFSTQKLFDIFCILDAEGISSHGKIQGGRKTEKRIVFQSGSFVTFASITSSILRKAWS